MRKIPILVAALVVLAGWALPGRAQSYVPGEVDVQLQPGTDISQFISLYGATVEAQSSYVLALRLGVDPTTDVGSLAAAMRTNPNVVAADPNYILGSFQTSGDQWNSVFDGSGGPAQYQSQYFVSQVDAQSLSCVGAGVTVAVLDTGISARPAFLAPQIVSGWNFVDGNSDADDRPYNLDDDGDGIADQAVGHGTMVAGVIYRLAPQVGLMPVRVLNSEGHGTLWNAAEGVRYATANGASVMNLSFGSPQNAGFLTHAIRDAYTAGIIVVTSAGNQATNVPQWPAGDPDAVAVAALDSKNVKASFSDYGADVAVSAPGVSIEGPYWDGRWAIWSGTSFSAPMVAAEAALLRSLEPQWSADAIRSRIAGTAVSVDTYNPGYAGDLGAGLIDIGSALGGL